MYAAQRIQNRFLRAIKYFPPSTRIVDIHAHFKIKSIQSRSAELLRKFSIAKRGHDLISAELEEFEQEIAPRERKCPTILDQMILINKSH